MRRFHCYIITLAVLAAIMSSPINSASADKVYSFVSYPIPLLVNDAEHGFFVDVLAEASRRAQLRYELHLYPTRRSMKRFESGLADAIIPALPATLAHPAALSRPIFAKRIHGVVLKGTPVPKSIEELHGKRVGLVRGFAYPDSIIDNDEIRVDYASTPAKSVQRLLNGWVDVVVADMFTISKAIPELGKEHFAFDLQHVLHAQPAYIAFQNTEEGQWLARRISAALDSMINDGTYDNLARQLASHGVGVLGKDLPRLP